MMSLLEKVLQGLVKIGEPHSNEKLDAFLAEVGTMGPAVFLTPWDMTLFYLDEQIGSIKEVEEFYT